MTTARLAGFASRAIALILDALILSGAVTAIGAGLALAASVVGLHLHSGNPIVASLAALGWALIVCVYFAGFWTLTGQTPGMRFMGLRVIDRTGTCIGQLQSIRRLVGMVLAALPLGAGFLLVLVDDRRRGLQDHIASTLVIYERTTARAAVVPPPAAEPRERAAFARPIGASPPHE